MAQMQPGDVVNYYSDASHSAIYIGDGMMVHASTYRHAGAGRAGEQCPDLQRPPVLTVGRFRACSDRRADLRGVPGRQAAGATGVRPSPRLPRSPRPPRRRPPRRLATAARCDLIGLGGSHTAPLLNRISAPDGRRRAGRDGVLGSRLAARHRHRGRRHPTRSSRALGRRRPRHRGHAPPAERIMFAPGAAAMSDDVAANCAAPRAFSLRRPRRHRRRRTALAHRRRRRLRRPPGPPAASGRRTVGATSVRRRPERRRTAPGRRPTTAPGGSARFVAESYGTQTLRALYLRACGPGHPDVATAVRDTLGADLPTVLVRWRHWMPG